MTYVKVWGDIPAENEKDTEGDYLRHFCRKLCSLFLPILMESVCEIGSRSKSNL